MMNPNIAKALFRDALAQVVDNKMFRLLVVLMMFFVVPTFVIGVREDGFVILFNWEKPYVEFFAYFGETNLPPNVHEVLIRAFQAVLVDGLAGVFGILFSVAATAFFLPRMLEKGAADTVFSKPVSRFTLMLSRYFAGVLFVSILATMLVGGMYFGLLLVSGYNDPGFLWTILTLIYLFAVFHAVSILLGVFTRSSVAAILLTLMFFVFNGCVHNAWRATELGRGKVEVADAEEAAEEEAAKSASDRLLDGLVTGLNVLHYTLPKTSDASLIANKLRKSVEVRNMELVDPDTDLTIRSAPRGYERDVRSSLAREGVTWIAPAPDGADEATIRLSRSSVDEASRAATAKALRSELREVEGVEDHESRRDLLANRRADVFRWEEDRAGAMRAREAWIFQGAQWVYRVEIDADSAWAAETNQEEVFAGFLDGFSFGDEDGDPFEMGARDPYERKFGWDAEWKYNAFFSIGSTLAFIAAMLAIAWLKLRRIDF